MLLFPFRYLWRLITSLRRSFGAPPAFVIFILENDLPALPDPPRRTAINTVGRLVNPAGTLIVDDGAVRALRSGKSLLPAGVVGVEGMFDRGDCVIIRTRAGIEAGRGLSAYTAGDIRLIAGHKSGEIATILGYRGRDEIIHRDDLVLTEAR